MIAANSVTQEFGGIELSSLILKAVMMVRLKKQSLLVTMMKYRHCDVRI